MASQGVPARSLGWRVLINCIRHRPVVQNEATWSFTGILCQQRNGRTQDLLVLLWVLRRTVICWPVIERVALLSVSFSPPVPSLQSSSSFSLFIHVLIAFNQSPQPHLSLFPDCQDLTLQLILFLTPPLSHFSYVAASVYAPAYLVSPAPHCNILFGSQPSQNLTQCPVLD